MSSDLIYLAVSIRCRSIQLSVLEHQQPGNGIRNAGCAGIPSSISASVFSPPKVRILAGNDQGVNGAVGPRLMPREGSARAALLAFRLRRRRGKAFANHRLLDP
jgi:hypothetical protein